MKTKELIEALQKLDPEKHVLFMFPNGLYKQLTRTFEGNVLIMKQGMLGLEQDLLPVIFIE